MIIVSRHPATINYLKGLFGGEAKVINHLANPDEIPVGEKVAGNLPINIVDYLVNVRKCEFYHVVLNIPPELRGKEINNVEKYIKIFRIKRIELEEVR